MKLMDFFLWKRPNKLSIKNEHCHDWLILRMIGHCQSYLSANNKIYKCFVESTIYRHILSNVQYFQLDLFHFVDDSLLGKCLNSLVRNLSLLPGLG